MFKILSFTKVKNIKRKVDNQLFHLLRLNYYRFIYGQNYPFAKNIEKLIYGWEKKKVKPDIPVNREEWDAQYQTGKWSFLDKADELVRYKAIIDYIEYFKPGGVVLDVGCGDGILLKHYKPYRYAKYVGLDISKAALDKLMPKADEKTKFIQVDAETYKPTELYDVIVFNETLYYFHDPLKVFQRYVESLNRSGLLIVSTYSKSVRAVAILRKLKTQYNLVAEKHVGHGKKIWICSVFDCLQ